MSISTHKKMPWSEWHSRLHKRLLAKKNLLPKDSCLLIAVSGGQDSMALLKLIVDLKRLHNWDVNIWHGDHNWHDQSKQIAKELKEWCNSQNLNFFFNIAKDKEANKEETARIWRYNKLAETAKSISKNKNQQICKYVLTGHTASDRAETLLMNLARGSDLQGLSSLKVSRYLNSDINLVRPLLLFSRDDTKKICRELNLPIWIDPSNQNYDLERNKIRSRIMPILDELHPGCSIRMSALSERLETYKENQDAMALYVMHSLSNEKGLCRKKLTQLPLHARSSILSIWLKENGVPNTSSSQLEDISLCIESGKKPGQRNLCNGISIFWNKESIELK